MSFWRLPQRPSSIDVRPAAAGARQGSPLLSPPAVARAPRAAPRQHGRLQVGRSWHFLSDLEPSKEASSLTYQNRPLCVRGFSSNLFVLEARFDSGGLFDCHYYELY